MLSFEKEISSSLKKNMDYVSNSQLVVEIPTSTLKPITRIVVKFDSSKIQNIESFTLSHAFNHVMSDLVIDKEVKNLSLKDDFVFKFDTPKSASHILIDIDSDEPIEGLIKSLKVFVSDDDSVVTIDNSEHIDKESISYQKAVQTDSNKSLSYLITDGSNKTIWQGDNYPANIDIDLEAIYDLNMVIVYFPKNQQIIFDLYGSNDGLNYSFIKHNDIEMNNQDGYKMLLPNNTHYSFVRINVLYNSGSDTVKVNQIRVFGKYLENRKQVEPFKFLMNDDFDNEKLTIDQALQGIISRRLNKKYLDWFEFRVENNSENYFKLENGKQKIIITGSTGVNIAAGLNYYLKNYCNVNISQKGMGDRTIMSDKVVPIERDIKKINETKYIYSYNYTTFSYTMAFWGEKEWQDELDWLALNGVNLVLDPIGQEAVWGLFLRKLGYSDTEIQQQVSFSTYSAWQWMGNISGVGGPVSLNWINDRTKLAHKNHAFMQALGMNPIFRAYGGLLPDDIKEKDDELNIIVQGQWCSFHRPDMLKTTDSSYQRLAKMFYQVQQDVLGNMTHFYSVDPFHEGGIMGDMLPEDVSKNLMENLLEYDDKAIWVIQSWQENPTPGLLRGIEEYKEQHAIVLDLYAEKSPQWIKDNPLDHGGKEFADTPWLFCMLNNFGGRMGLSGHMSDLQESYNKAVNESNYSQGIGITPEASLNNPILYDYFFDLVWRDKNTNIDINDWLYQYSNRRYGKSANAFESLKIQLETVYKSELNNLGQGAPESIINARPNSTITAASTWGNSQIGYVKKDLIEAMKYLFKDYERLATSDGYRFDLVSITMQVLSNYVQEIFDDINNDIANDNLSSFKSDKDKFIKATNLVDAVTDEISIYRLDTWENQAMKIVTSLDDFAKSKARIDARAIVTTWGSIKQANSGGLHDYSNRQWSGLTKNLYLKRWNKWLDEQEKRIEGKKFKVLNDRDWFNLEWNWVIDQNKNEENSRNNIPLKNLVQRTLEIVDYG